MSVITYWTFSRLSSSVRGTSLSLFPEASVRLQNVSRDEEAEQLVIALQGQCAAVEAIHGWDAPVEGQIGHEQLLHLLGNDQIGECLFAQLRWAAFQEHAAVVGHIARIVGDGAGAQEAPCRGWGQARRRAGSVRRWAGAVRTS